MSDTRPSFGAGVITVSDRSSAGVRPDSAGPAVCELLGSAGYVIERCDIVPDDQLAIERAILDMAHDDVALCVTCGGTGVGPRDVTPEATAAVCERMVPGLGEAMRAASAQITPNAWLSRATAGICGRTLVINVPGSPKGARENLEAVLSPLSHALRTLRSAPARKGSGASDLAGCRYLVVDADGIELGGPAARETLACLRKRGWKIAAVSFDADQQCRDRLGLAGVAEQFDLVCGQGETARTLTDVVAEALRGLGAVADMALFVGTDGMGVRAAVANGIACVGVSDSEGLRAGLEDAGATACVAGVEELAGLLAG